MERGEEPQIRCSEFLCKGEKGDPIQNHREGVTLGESLSTQDCDWQLPRLAEEKLRPMLVAIEGKCRSSRPAVLLSPQHRQAAQLVEAIAGINERSSARLRFLCEELKEFQCLLSPSTPFLYLALPVHLHLYLKCGRKPFLFLLLSSCHLYC